MIRLPVYGFRKTRRSYQPTWLADRGGVLQYAYGAVNSRCRRKVGETNLLGEFRHCIRWKATYGFELELPGGSRLLYADHIARQGGYPDSPAIIKA